MDDSLECLEAKVTSACGLSRCQDGPSNRRVRSAQSDRIRPEAAFRRESSSSRSVGVTRTALGREKLQQHWDSGGTVVCSSTNQRDSEQQR